MFTLASFLLEAVARPTTNETHIDLCLISKKICTLKCLILLIFFSTELLKLIVTLCFVHSRFFYQKQFHKLKHWYDTNNNKDKVFMAKTHLQWPPNQERSGHSCSTPENSLPRNFRKRTNQWRHRSFLYPKTGVDFSN